MCYNDEKGGLGNMVHLYTYWECFMQQTKKDEDNGWKNALFYKYALLYTGN